MGKCVLYEQLFLAKIHVSGGSSLKNLRGWARFLRRGPVAVPPVESMGEDLGIFPMGPNEGSMRRKYPGGVLAGQSSCIMCPAEAKCNVTVQYLTFSCIKFQEIIAKRKELESDL